MTVGRPKEDLRSRKYLRVCDYCIRFGYNNACRRANFLTPVKDQQVQAAQSGEDVRRFAIIFEHAARLASQCNENDLDVMTFKKTILPLKPDSPHGPLLLVIRPLAHAATIQCQKPFCLNSVSRSKSISAAMAIVGLLSWTDVHKFGYINMIMG
ncbi:hypothetical protein DFH09DRAFT_1076090 [Mycena vulgaris]|nr:hypothetical protein DFH09DRAFT_1076090 [Mycena vulgaris]